MFGFTVYISLIGGRHILGSLMAYLWLFGTVSGLTVTAVFSQNPSTNFADPPPLPAAGTFLLVRMINFTKQT